MDNSIVAKKEFLKKFSDGTIAIGDRKLKEIDSGSHFINIPETLANEMISLIPENKNSLIAVPYSVDIVFFLLAKGYHNVVFFSDSEYKSKLIQSKDFCNLSAENVILFSDYLDLIEKMKGYRMKFDAIIMNPPYGKLAPKILKGLVESEIANEIVTIQPLYQFTTVKPQGDKNRTLKDGTDISKYVEKIIVKSGRMIWPEIVLMYTLGILKINTKIKYDNILVNFDHFDFFDIKKSIKFSNLNEIPQYGYHKIQQSIYNKIKDFQSIVSITNTKDGNFSHYIPRRQICTGVRSKFIPGESVQLGLVISRGSQIKDTLGKVLSNFTKSNMFSGTVNKDFLEDNKFCFNSYEEAINGRDYLLSPFARFCILKFLVDAHVDKLDLQQIPLFDFTTPVTAERIQEVFCLTDQELEFIADFGKQLNEEYVDWSKYD